MKIYTQVKNFNNKSYIGIELLNDKNQTNYSTAIKTDIKSEKDAYLIGIRRAMSFIKNNKPLYTQDNIIVYIPTKLNIQDFNLLNAKLLTDSYIKNTLKTEQNIIYNNKVLTEEDNYHLMCAGVQINNEIFKDRMILLNSQSLNK